ncbi:hypothetical protein SteCoe_961 [Stentor coeruleus]|uniref:C2H2-type domain-containing protein n=1 Tax=Stentor coeruleus TaxID=5963 RepID=A0A1R2D2S9_9CILI|nr:hypothetical protein SteCoe_961 [Stentor coeruleus]
MKAYNKQAETSMNIYCCMYTDCTCEYSTKFNLKRHVESVHLHIKKYQCNICSGYFSSKQSLKEHRHIHSGAMPFKCSVCDKFFRQASQLSLHKRIHILEGQTPNYSKVKIEEFPDDIKPLEFNYEVCLQKYLLPIVCSERKIEGFRVVLPSFC